MAATEHGDDRRAVSLAAFLPAALLGLLVPVLGTMEAVDIYGIYSIFWSFAGGITVLDLSAVIGRFRLASRSTARSLFGLGDSLGVVVVRLSLVFGCVFGCPG